MWRMSPLTWTRFAAALLVRQCSSNHGQRHLAFR